MDIFIRNIPLLVREKQLRAFLKPHLESVGINTFVCSIFNPKKVNQGRFSQSQCANITIFDVSAANVFLDAHGTPHGAQMSIKPRIPLRLHGHELRCTTSIHPPDELLVESLRYEEADRAKRHARPGRTIRKKDNSSLQHTYQIVGLDNGIWDYQDVSLLFHSCFHDLRKGSLVLGKKALVIVLQPGEMSAMEVFQIRIQYHTIESIATSRHQKPIVSLTLNQSPNFYRISQSNGLSAGMNNLSLTTNKKSLNHHTDRVRTCGLSDTHAKVSGFCLVYRIQVQNFSQLVSIGSFFRNMNGGPGEPEHDISTVSISRNPASECGALVKHLTSAADSHAADSQAANSDSMPFFLRFQLQRLVQNGYMNPARVLELAIGLEPLIKKHSLAAIVDAIQKMARSLPFISTSVDTSIFYVSKILDSIDDLASDFRRKGSIYEMAEKHQHLALIHKVIVTPCNLYLEGPQLEPKNRVLREYPQHTEYFIRVSFLDEDEQNLQYETKVDRDEIFWSRFSGIINGMIDICGRRYSFLGFSHSSLRTHQCWFMSPFFHAGTLQIPNQVIKDLGDFTSIRSPAKCAARIGQAFSDTTDSIPLPINCQIVRLDDVERNGRCFTDGVGTISSALLFTVWEHFTRTRKQHATLLQVRQAGAKGMVLLDTTLEGEKLCLRPSMVKFEGSTDSNLEICGAGYKALPLYLNQQLIKILEDLGTESQAFLDLQKQATDNLKDIVQDPSAAADYLERNLAATAPKLPSLIRKIAELGLDFRDDDFMRNSVDIVALTQLRDIKYRARIPVKKGYTLLGIADMTNFLRPGQVHVSVRNNRGQTYNLRGDVVVTRAPALHPGDLQLLEAVDVPEDSPLLSLHNCIIFSTQGERDVPSCLSGGDLDGDLYGVIFEEKLFPKEYHAPADYPRLAPMDILRPVEIADITEFFVRFMETDQLGNISQTHKQAADQKSLGTKDPSCIKLAGMASTAVDYSKTGIAVDIKEMPHDFNRKVKPDFMARAPNLIIDGKVPDMSSGVLLEYLESDSDGPEDPTSLLHPDRPRPLFYESQKILGQLYRAVDEDAFLPALHKQDTARSIGAPLQRQSLMEMIWMYIQKHCLLIQYDHYAALALEIKQTYEDKLATTMFYYSSHPRRPLTELEVFAGVILGRSGGIPNKRTRETNVDMKGCFDRDVNYIVDWICRGDLDSHDSDGNNEFAQWDDQDSGNDGKSVQDVEASERMARSIAVLKVAMQEPGEMVQGAGELKSFKYIAAAVCLREMGRMFGEGWLRG